MKIVFAFSFIVLCFVIIILYEHITGKGRVTIRGLLITVIIGIISFAGIVFSFISSGGGNPNRWDKLSNEEKEWYERNYGDGKSEAIDKAIEDYK